MLLCAHLSGTATLKAVISGETCHFQHVAHKTSCCHQTGTVGKDEVVHLRVDVVDLHVVESDDVEVTCEMKRRCPSQAQRSQWLPPGNSPDTYAGRR